MSSGRVAQCFYARGAWGLREYYIQMTSLAGPRETAKEKAVQDFGGNKLRIFNYLSNFGKVNSIRIRAPPKIVFLISVPELGYRKEDGQNQLTPNIRRLKMTQKILEEDGIVILGAISKEEDLKQPGCICINHPPADCRCQVCGKHISELKPFGAPDDPLVGDFSGELLVKIYRTMGPYNEAAEKAWQEAEKAVGPNMDNIHSWLVSKYGEKEADHISLSCEAYAMTKASWECRDCVCLSEDEYLEAIYKRWEKNKDK